VLIFQMAIGQSIRVMSYNIRFDNPADGGNAWPNRSTKVTRIIQKYDPDFIGIQEALYHQLQDLKNVLPGYSFVGLGRDDGLNKGEYSAIFYKHSRFGMMASSTFWLSETPETPGSKSWDAAITRIATWARFFDKKSHSELFFLNTHFDHIGKEARTKSAILIKSKLIELSQGNPIIVTGDFNCTPDEIPYHEMIIESDSTLFDASKGNTAGTYCGFEVGSSECTTIDYIFHSKEWSVTRYQVLNDNNGKYYPSDHLPVLAELELTPKN